MTFVQAWRADASAGASSIALTINPSAGNALVVWYNGDSGTAGNVTCSDGGSTFVRTINDVQFDSGGAPGRHSAFYALSVAGGSRSLTVTLPNNRTARSIRVEEHSGLNSYIDVAALREQASPGTGTDGVQTNAINITSQPAWVIGFAANWGTGTPTPAVGTGVNNNGSGFDYFGDYARFGDRRVTATGNATLNFTAGTNALHFTAAMAFTEAGGDPDPTIYTESLDSALSVSDAIPIFMLRNRQLSSSIAMDDEAIQQVISSLVLSRILSSTLPVDDEIRAFSRRNRMTGSAISITEGDLVRSSVTNMDAADSLSISDEQALFMLRRRLLGEAIGVSDEILAQTTGVIIYQRILDSLTTITDESVAFAYLRRLAGSNISVGDRIDPYTILHRMDGSEISVSDQIGRYALVTRALLDALIVDDDFDASLVLDQIIARILTSDIGLFDEPTSAMQRFILLSEMLSVQDDMTAAHIPHVGGLFVPRIMIGFDQPKIELGGYRV